MGFGTSVTEAIFFIASVIVALAIVGVVSISVGSLAGSFNAKSDDLSSQLRTSVKITGDSCYLGGSTYVYVKNVGSSFINANATNVFLSGAALGVNSIHLYRDNSWVEYSTIDAWRPGELARFTTTSSLPTGYNRLSVVVENGVYDQVEYSDC